MTARPIPAGGISWSLTDTGSGDAGTLLLLHGNRDGKEMWQPLAAELPDFRVIAVDLPGHGGTPLPASTDMAEHVSSLGELLGELDVSELTVVGHSLGGQLAIGLAAARPDLVGRLVVIGSALAHTSSFKPAAAASNEDMIRHVTPFFFPETSRPSPRRAAAMEQVFASWAAIPWAQHQRLGALVRIDVPAAAALVKAPTLLIYGEHDRICAFDPHGAAIVSAINDCDHVIIEDAGHFAYLEFPELVANAIRHFAAPA
jgi:pimeloyl-ACP methyl ester carboxylesterase